MHRAMSEATEAFWGDHAVAADEAVRLAMGPVTLVLGRRTREWVITRAQDADPLDPRIEVERGAPWPDDEAAHRFMDTSDGGVLTLSPRGADRAVIVRPRQPFHLPGGQDVTLHVTTPAWCVIAAGDTTLWEVPTHRPSDTWFGPSTREGELCYATRTRASVDLDELPRLPARPVTSVVIRNAAAGTLEIVRFRIPTPALRVYQADDGSLFTETVEVAVTEEGAGQVEVRPGPPDAAPGAVLVGERREDPGGGGIARVFSALVS